MAGGGLRTWRRGETALVSAAAVIGMLGLGMAVPYVVGEAPETQVSASRAAPAAETAAGTTTTTTMAATATTAVSTPAGPAGPGRRATGRAAATIVDSDGRSPGAPGGEALTATDRGVFPDRIKVGFLILDIATVGRLGVDVAIDPEQQQAAMQAYVDDVNASGGINGRRIEPVYRTFDVTSADDQRAACLYLTQDQKVFAVIIGFNLPEPLLCLVEENQTPTYNNVSNNPDSLFARAAGRLIASFARSSRMMAVWADELERMGVIGGGKRVGILSDDQTDPGAEVARQLEDFLKSRGHRVARRGQLAADLQTSASQVPIEVNNFRTAQVDVVMLVTGNTVRGTQFVQTAESQNYRPKYSVSDYSSNFTDSGSANMPSSFHGSIGITATRNNEWRDSRPEPALATTCRQVYEARSNRTLMPRGSNEHGLTMNICDMIRIFTRSARAVGAGLTRPRLGPAVEALGPVPTASWGDGAFAPGKPDLNDFIRTIKWDQGCRCWQPDGGFRQGRY